MADLLPKTVQSDVRVRIGDLVLKAKCVSGVLESAPYDAANMLRRMANEIDNQAYNQSGPWTVDNG